jgi:serine protease Do
LLFVLFGLWGLPGGTALARAPLGAVGGAVDRAQDAVVNVQVIERSGQVPPALSPWDRSAPDEASVTPGTGSGFLIDANGLVLTNHHLVESALLIHVTLADGRRVEARRVGSDPTTDVALLRLDGVSAGLPTLKLGDSSRLEVGDWVVALGNPGQTVTASIGILSAKARSLQRGSAGDFLQTDAAIHPGNSGGPLLNLKAEVVGLNTALLGGGTGVGFAVSSAALQTLIPQLMKHGHMSRGWVGAYVKELTPLLARKLAAPVRHGAVVTFRLADSPAARAGLQQDDVITRIDRQNVESASWLVRALVSKSPGTTLGFTVYRGKKKAELRVQVGELPEWQTVESPEGEEMPRDPLEVLGFTLEEVPGGKAGALVSFVRPGSPAAQAGLREGALIQEAAGRVVHSAQEVNRLLRQARSGSRLLLRLQLPQLPYPRLRALRIP